jgi:hypothetical protein
MSPLFTLLWGEEVKAATHAAGLRAEDWLALSRQAAQQRLRPLLHHRSMAGSWPVPPDLARQWQKSYNRATMRALGQRAALTRIGTVLAAEGVRAAVLKGGAFVWAPGFKSALRPMRDLDLLIAPDDAGRVVEILSSAGFSGGGAQLGESGKHLPPMTSGEVTVEPHLHLFDTYDDQAAESERQFIERAWQRAQPSVVSGVLALCPTDTLLHLILHAVLDHQFNNGPLLLEDLKALTGSGRIDWALFWDEAARLDAVRACQLALGVGHELAGVGVDWRGHEPGDLGADHVARVARLMLIDMDRRSAVGWPGQLLRLPLRRWPGQLLTMLRRRRERDTTVGEPGNEAGLRSAIGQALGAQGRSDITDAIDLTRWLQRSN